MSTQTSDEHIIFHPVKFHIDSDPIIELHDYITRLVWTGSSGAAILGFSRNGKTYGLRASEGTVLSRNGGIIPFVRCTVDRRDIQTVRATFQMICRSLKISIKGTPGATELRDLLVINLAEKADVAQSQTIILAVDETQRLKIKQLDAFCEIFDILEEEYQLRLLVLFIGNQEQLGELLSKIEDGKNQHIKGRFFKQTFYFHGLRSVQEVAYCLKQYDEIQFPPGGPTITQHFLPGPYAEGFRLELKAPDIWGTFHDLAFPAGIKEWGMKYFVFTINVLLTDYLASQGIEALNDETIACCLKLSGLLSSRVST